MKRRIFVFGILVLLSLVALHFYSAYFIVEIRNPVIEFLRPLPVHVDEILIKGISGKEIEFYSNDGLKMSAYLGYAKTDSAKGAIILVHGIRANKRQYAKMIEKLSARGYHSIALDLRAHGGSKGRFCTFGAKEKYDVMALVDYLVENESMEKIGIWGQSLGGAVALQAMAIDPRLQFGIVESTFNKLSNVVHQYTKYYLGFKVEPLTNHVLKRAGVIADFDPSKVAPEEACTQISQPILMAHGAADKRIPVSFGRANFNKLKSQQKEFIEIPSAGHGGVWRVGGQEYFNSVFDFLDNQ